MFRLKREFLLDPNVTFLNHGSFGAVPRQVFKCYQKWQRELESQPVEFLGRRFNGLMSEARGRLGNYLGTQAENIVFTSNVTVSLNIVARSLELKSGDEVLSTDHEYGALDRTWRFMAKQSGFSYINLPIPLPMDDPVDFVNILWSGVTSRTRVIFISHITSPTAQLFPVEVVTRRARNQGILTVIDGAHAPGQIPLDLEDLGADFYGGNLHKWLCAPKGAGFLYARPEVQHLLKPLVVSWGYEAEVPGSSRFVDEHEWTGTRDISAFLAVPEAIRFQEQHDWDHVRSACSALAFEAQERICNLKGMPGFYPARFSSRNTGGNMPLQMASAPLPDGVDLVELKKRLYAEARIEIPMIHWNGRKMVRISIQGYNSRRDVDKLISVLRKSI